MHFNRYIAHWAKHRPDAVALRCEGRSLNWKEIDLYSARVAACLLEQGVIPGDRVGILLENSLDWCLAFIGAFRAGAIAVPFNRMFGAFELEQIAGDADCMLAISCPAEIGKLGIDHPAEDRQAIHVYDMRADGQSPLPWSDILATERPFRDHRRSDDDGIAICYTSGTTGVPKGILLTHRSVDTMVQSLILTFGWTIGAERFVILAPLAFTGTCICVLCPLLATGGIGFIEKGVDPARALDLIVRERITYFPGVPALFERIASAPGFAEADISSIRTGNAGGAPVPRALLEKYLAKGVTIRQQYGTSEASGAITNPDFDLAVQCPESAGHPLPTFDLEIRDADGCVVAANEPGEIWIRGPQMMQGYWRKPEANAEAFDAEGWYRTGDLGRYDPDLGLFVLDRKKNMLISGGVNVYPAEVERAMARIEGVEEAVVFGMPSEKWGDEVVAIVHGPTLASGAALIPQVRELVGAYKTPRRILLSPDPLPRTASAKIRRQGLQELFLSLPDEEAVAG
ncbi:acyl-CoA synthetase [Sphingobium jiangsuense]|uniref:Fatty-acyl-CoA synthase n=1 Tax=Sphingobium jiangsuense TaxID=870476 RepID=A0A7W6FPZ9_9SPHN|nr:class I adenylate-forming enzyme family protein [Sphingobium jiangsuense]MBB3926398.1 fatty-acyl-CoA synthase [Sphingobium jiangsuense]GLS99061.1 acyl-CoA synthetase [Sphingobium jiangsuense]